MKRLLSIVFLALTVGSLSAGVTYSQQSSPAADQISDAWIESDHVTFGGTKRSVVARVEHPRSEDDLGKLAHAIREQDLSAEITFIEWCLPDMEVGAGAWATTHFNPTLDVVIYGYSEEKAALFETSVDNDTRDVIGHWLDPWPHRVTIFREGSRVFMEMEFSDGSQGQEELLQHPDDPSRFDPVEATWDGVHYIVNAAGELEYHDDMGLITALTRL